jgi:hypothetical protein
MKDPVEMSSCGMIHIPSLVKIGASVQALLRSRLINLRACNVGITTGRDL